MSKKNLFRFATLSLLVLFFFLMPLLISEVPIAENGTLALLLKKLASLLNLTVSQKTFWAQFINAAFIWLTIFIVTRFIKQVLGWRAAFFGAILLFLSPRFVGASLLNLVDIPFTFAYILSITQIYSFARELPHFKVKRIALLTLSAVFTAFIHPAGMILILYMFFFLLLSFVLKINVKWLFIPNKKQAVLKLITTVFSISLLIFIVAFVVAKYIYNIPITQPFTALKLFNDFANTDPQTFESKLVLQNQVPNHYLFKYLFITTPLVAFIGLILFFFFFYKMRKELNPLLIFVIIGTLFFPLIFSSLVQFTANAFWSIYYMSVPLLVIIAVMGVEYVLRTIDDRYVNSVISFVLFLLLLPPLRHIIVTAPATTVYFNEISGSVSSSYSKYSIDLNSHYPQIASKWLIQYIYDYDIRYFKDHKTILILTDAAINCEAYFENYPFINVQNGTLDQFNNGKGEYFISLANTQNPLELKNATWPPKNAIYSIIVEDVPVATFLKRN